VLTGLIFALLSHVMCVAAETPSGGTPAPSTVSHVIPGTEHEELHAANAVLFLFTALSFGLLLRRAMSGFIIPYTGLLVVRTPFRDAQ
jgi:hypothetical protein